MAVVQYRVDGRMIHGQIRSAWGPYLHVDDFIVVNEKTANTPMQVTLLELAASGDSVMACSPAKAAEVLKSGEFQGDRTMVVFKYIQDAVDVVKLGVKIDEIGISGIYDVPGANKKKYDKNLFLGDEEIAAMRYLDSQGVKMVMQIVPDYTAKNVKDLVKF